MKLREWKKDRMKPENGTEPEKKSISDPNALNTSIEIPFYAPNQGIAPKEYQISEQLNELETNLEKICMDFVEKAHPDAFNSNYMDAVIERVCAEAVKYVKVQRSDHVYLITKLLDDMHKGDLIKCMRKLENLKLDKEENAKELALYRRIMRSGTSLAD